MPISYLPNNIDGYNEENWEEPKNSNTRKTKSICVKKKTYFFYYKKSRFYLTYFLKVVFI